MLRVHREILVQLQRRQKQENETYTRGSFGDDDLKLVHDLRRRLRSASGDGRETSWLIQRVSLEIQRGNAASLLATILRTSDQNTIGTKRLQLVIP